MRALKAALFAFVVLLGMARFAALAAIDIPNFDEEAGIGEAHDLPVSTYLYSGPVDQLSTSPLHYLVDKAWMGAFSFEPHRHFNLNLFFRFLPLLYVALATGFACLLSFSLCSSSGFPASASAIFAVLTGVFFQSTYPILRYATLADRPYALWFLFSMIHLCWFARCKKTPSVGMAVLGFLLSFTSFAAPVQSLASSLARAIPMYRTERKRAVLTMLELVPGLLTALWYWSHSHSMPLPATFAPGFRELWLEALVKGTWGMRDSFFSGASLTLRWSSMPLLAIALCPVFLLLPLFRGIELRRAHSYGFVLLLASFPLTLFAYYVTQSLQPRYFTYLYPVLGFAHVLSVLALALLLAEKAGKMSYGISVLLLWSALQGAYRLPVMTGDFLEARASEHFALFVREPLPTCPEKFGVYRRGIARPVALGAVDLQKLQTLCLPRVSINK